MLFLMYILSIAMTLAAMAASTLANASAPNPEELRLADNFEMAISRGDVANARSIVDDIKTQGLMDAVAFKLAFAVKNAKQRHSSDESSSQEARTGSVPSVAYTVEVVEEGYGTICGGVIIGHNWVLIDGWCTLDPELDKMAVRAGSSIPGEGTLHRVSQWVRHPSFNAQKRTYDVALLNVFPAFEYGQHVYNALLPTTNETSPDAAHATFHGWGTLPSADAYRGNLKTSSLYIFREEACVAILGDKYSPTKLCARETSNQVSLCWFDNGGPLVSNNVVYGIGIFTERRCSDPNSVKVFTRVAAVRDWIDETTKHNLY